MMYTESRFFAKPITELQASMRPRIGDVEAHKVGGHADAMLYKVLGACDDHPVNDRTKGLSSASLFSHPLLVLVEGPHDLVP